MSWGCILLVSSPSPSPSPKVLSTSIPTQRPPQLSYPFWRAVLPGLLSLSLSHYPPLLSLSPRACLWDSSMGRSCLAPSTNPGCISSFAFPGGSPRAPSIKTPVQKLEEAILKTQKNPRILSLEDTPYGDVVGYRSMATKVTYVYPFTTALCDSKGQEERLKKIIDQLGWRSREI